MTLTKKEVCEAGRVIWRGFVQTPYDDPKLVEIDLTEALKNTDARALGAILKYSLFSGFIKDVDGPPPVSSDKVMEIS